MKSRFVFSAFCMLVALTMATGAFAQGIFTVSGGIEPRGRENGHAEVAGGVTLFLSSGEIIGDEEDTVVIDYGADITNAVDPTADMDGITVNICSVDVVPMDVADTPTNEAAMAVVNGSTLTISLDGKTCNDTSDANARINVDGVLLSLVGSGASSVMASVTATGAVRLPGGVANRVTVIENVVDPLEDENVKVGQTLTLVRHTGKAAKDDPTEFKLVITEAHIDSFDDAELELKFSGIPDDVDVVDLDAWVTTKKDFDDDDTETDEPANQIPVGTMTTRVADTPADGEVTVFLSGLTYDPTPDDDANQADDTTPAGMLDPNAIDVVVVRGSIKGSDEEDLLPIDLDIQVTVDLGRIGDDDGEYVPRFDSQPTTAMTVIESTSAQTVMKVAYVLSEGMFDSGIAVSQHDRGGGWRSPLRLLHGRSGDEVLHSIHDAAADHDDEAAQRAAHCRRAYR